MNADFDAELRERFAAQRRAEQAAAPAWNLPAPKVQRAAAGARPIFWLPWAAAACVLLGLLFWPASPSGSPVDLTHALPEFFTTDGSPLFAGVDSPSAMPSDFLLPTHLTIQLP